MQGSVPRTDADQLRVVFTAEQVRARIDAMAEELERVYQSGDLVLVVIAEGARRFAQALVEALEARWMLPQVVVVRASRTRGTELAEVRVEQLEPTELEGRDVLILDDIADEGRTLDAVTQIVREGEPRTLEAAVLVSKSHRRRIDLDIRFVGFELDRGWVVGFGMDLDGRYRELDHIAVVPGTD